MYGNNISAYIVLAGNSEVGELGKPKRRWEYKIKNYLREKECRAWIRLIWLRIWSRGELF
jgi:hypothetical protein